LRSLRNKDEILSTSSAMRIRYWRREHCIDDAVGERVKSICRPRGDDVEHTGAPLLGHHQTLLSSSEYDFESTQSLGQARHQFPQPTRSKACGPIGGLRQSELPPRGDYPAVRSSG
jgi:hypothetical protein